MQRERKHLPRKRSRLPPSQTSREKQKRPRHKLSDSTYVKVPYLDVVWDNKKTHKDWLKELKRTAKSPKKRAAYETMWPKPGLKFDIEHHEIIVADKAKLNRSKWTEEDREKHGKGWKGADENLALVSRHLLRKRRKFQAEYQQHQQKKAERAERRTERENKKEKVQLRKVSKANLDGRVFDYLSETCNTVNLLSKKLGAETRDIRHSLKRLYKARKVEKLSPRRWGKPSDEPKPKRKRKRLSDVEPKKRRKRRSQ